MTEIHKNIEKIRILNVEKVGNFDFSNKSKIPFKAHSFLEVMNLRMLDFCESIDLLLKANHIIPSLSLIRSLFENVAISYRISSAIDNSLLENKLTEDFDDLISNISLGTRYDNDLKAINILTHIEKLNKEFKGMKQFYEDLCEFVHPNWDGVLGSYSKLYEEGKYIEITKVFSNEHALYKWFESCFLLNMVLFIKFSINIKSKLPLFSRLCDSES